MYIINVVARVCSSPLPAPCPRNKARVIPDATKLIPPPHSLFDQITGNSHLNDGSSPGQRIGNLESLMQDPDGQERKLWPTTQGLWSFPTAASSPPPAPLPTTVWYLFSHANQSNVELKRHVDQSDTLSTGQSYPCPSPLITITWGVAT